MAREFTMGAKLTLRDDFSRNLRPVIKATNMFNSSVGKAEKATKSWTDTNGRFVSSASRSQNAASRLGGAFGRLSTVATKSFGAVRKGISEVHNGFGRLRSGILRTVTSIQGLALAFGGAVAASKAFDATIGASARMELSEVQIGAMFRNQAKALEYMNNLRQQAIDSPILNQEAMFSNSKSFIALSKDTKQLKEMWKLTELMAAMDPVQGVEGAVFSLRELFSGDAVSMVERFEMPRQIMNDIKKMKLEDQIVALERLFKKMGFDQKYLNKVTDTSIGQWTQIKEKVAETFRAMGKDGLFKIKPELEKFNRWLGSDTAKNIERFGAEVLGGFVGTVIDGVNSAINYINTHFSGDKFRDMGFKAKFEFVMGDLWGTFTNWFDTTGSKQVADMTSFILEDMGTYIINHIDEIAKAGGELGWKLVTAMGETALNSIPGMIDAIGKQLGGARDAFSNWVNGRDPAELTDNWAILNSQAIIDDSLAKGLHRVPYDGFIAELHKGERVLTAAEAKALDSSSNRTYQAPIATQASRPINIGKLVDKIEIHAAPGQNGKQLFDEFIDEFYRRAKDAKGILSTANMGELL